MTFLGIHLLGFNAQNAHKLWVSAVVLGVILLIQGLLRLTIKRSEVRDRSVRLAFWVRQTASLVALVVGVVAFVSIWFDDPRRLSTGLGFFSAGLAFALQKVVTSFAGYFV